MPGRSPVEGSNERRRRLNCCSLPFFLGAPISCPGSGSITVGAVVMIAGAVGGHIIRQRIDQHARVSNIRSGFAGTVGTGGVSRAACSFAFTDSCDSEA
jgi:hypothetical protein